GAFRPRRARRLSFARAARSASEETMSNVVSRERAACAASGRGIGPEGPRGGVALAVAVASGAIVLAGGMWAGCGGEHGIYDHSIGGAGGGGSGGAGGGTPGNKGVGEVCKSSDECRGGLTCDAGA